MAEIDQSATPKPGFHLDKAWLTVLILPVLVAIADLPLALETVRFGLQSLLSTAPFILFAISVVAYLKASGSETLLARAFEGRQGRMIVMAALVGGISPFCSCEVIPFIAAMLALGAPLSAVMAFWIASPLMDPAMFAITAGTLGFSFATAKAIAAVGMGLFGGYVVWALSRTAIFSNPLRAQTAITGCGCATSPLSGKPEWKFWHHAERREMFRDTFLHNLLFLTKWLLLAYMFQALMLAWVPAELIAGVLGGNGIKPIILGALVGAPAYLNGYAAVPLVDALLAQGMSQGAAMSFMLAGGVSSIPAAIAVWALVKPRVFFAYLFIAMTGAVFAGMIWAAVA